MNFKKRLKYIISELSMSRRQFADAADVSIRLIENWIKGASPRLDSLEKVILKHNINPNFLILGEGRPFLKKKWSRMDEKEFREADYKEFVFLVEHADDINLFLGFCKIVGFKDYTKPIHFEYKWSWAVSFLAKIFGVPSVEVLLRFYASILRKIVSKFANDAPLDHTEVFVLCSLGRISFEELKKLTPLVVTKKVEFREIEKSIPFKTKWKLELYGLQALSGEAAPDNLVFKGIQKAFEKLLKAVRRQEIPSFCWPHDRVYWSKCPACSLYGAKKYVNEDELNVSEWPDKVNLSKENVDPDMTIEKLESTIIESFKQHVSNEIDIG
ncbi:MAG: helix-turn-helix domain-containing protein [Proteobacteria bacterium]|nr:helix-turn-helix domain-containing protein [Pseudomonadota bacterium]